MEDLNGNVEKISKKVHYINGYDFRYMNGVAWFLFFTMLLSRKAVSNCLWCGLENNMRVKCEACGGHTAFSI